MCSEGSTGILYTLKTGGRRCGKCAAISAAASPCKQGVGAKHSCSWKATKPSSEHWACISEIQEILDLGLKESYSAMYLCGMVSVHQLRALGLQVGSQLSCRALPSRGRLP